jgi:hypothetical protein
MTKQERYDELEKRDDLEYEEFTERLQLFYEMYPEQQYWRKESPNLIPHTIWGIDTSCYE